jgi:hypothetical protein
MGSSARKPAIHAAENLSIKGSSVRRNVRFAAKCRIPFLNNHMTSVKPHPVRKPLGSVADAFLIEVDIGSLSVVSAHT